MKVLEPYKLGAKPLDECAGTLIRRASVGANLGKTELLKSIPQHSGRGLGRVAAAPVPLMRHADQLGYPRLAPKSDKPCKLVRHPIKHRPAAVASRAPRNNRR